MRARTATWFETKIKYDKMMDNGLLKTTTESYVIDALSFTEAESQILEEMSAYISGDFKITDIKPATFKEVFFSDMELDDKWYKVKVQLVTIDEKTEKEKLTNVMHLVQASSLQKAVKYIDEEMDKGVSDYIIAAVNETKIIDVFEHHVSTKQQKNDVPEYEEQQ